MAPRAGSTPIEIDSTAVRTPATGTGTRPSALRFEHKRHMYFDGKRWLPSVTGIVGKAEDKSGLLHWTAEQVATCAIEEAAEVSRLRRLQDDDAAHEWLSKAADRKRDAASVNGSDLHDVADRMQSGAPLPDYLHDNVKAMAENVLAFLSDFRVRVLHSEVRLAHRNLGYAGTTDILGVVPQYGDVPVVVDWKTSESMYRNPKFHHGKNAMQLAPYAHAEVMFWDDKTESDMIEVSQEVGLIVMIRPEGYKVYDYGLPRSWEQFKRAFASYHWWRDVDELYRGPIRPAAPPQPTAADLHQLIAAAPDEATLDAIWEQHGETPAFTPEHLAAMKARLAEIDGVLAQYPERYDSEQAARLEAAGVTPAEAVAS